MNTRGERARLLLLPLRCTARVPTSEKGGSWREQGGGQVRVWSARGHGGTGVGARPALCLNLGLRLREPCAPPHPSLGVSRLASPSPSSWPGISPLGFLPLGNPERAEPLTLLVWPLTLHNSSPLSPHQLLPARHRRTWYSFGWGELGETEVCLGSPLLPHVESRRGRVLAGRAVQDFVNFHSRPLTISPPFAPGFINSLC